MAEIAELTGETPANVLGTCSFYTMFKRRPCGRLLVSVCTNVTCLVTGGPEILEHLDDDVRDRRRGRRRRGRVHRRVRRRAGDAGQLRVPREARRRQRPRRSSSEYKRGDRTARTISGRSSGARRDVVTGPEETRIVTKRLHERPDDSWTIDGALASGCYDVLRDVLAQRRPDGDPGAGRSSGLRGRGGANFATGQKWSFLPEGVLPRYLVVNGDEGEPSTFKDRMLVERDPHQLIEGIVIAAYAIKCNLAFVYLRGEFALGYDRLDAGDRRRARARASSARTSSGRASTSRSSCTAARARTSAARRPRLLESLEGERGMPRLKPPFPAIEGLYAKPTVVNNVETLSTRAAHRARWAARSTPRSASTGRPARASSRSPVTSSGPATTKSSSAARSATSSTDSRAASATTSELKFFLPGGASFQWLTGSDEHLDAPLRHGLRAAEPSAPRSVPGAIMVFDETTDPLLVAWRLAKFYSHESCGKCTPCREGTGWIEKVLYRMAQRPRAVPRTSTC